MLDVLKDDLGRILTLLASLDIWITASRALKLNNIVVPLLGNLIFTTSPIPFVRSTS